VRLEDIKDKEAYLKRQRDGLRRAVELMEGAQRCLVSKKKDVGRREEVVRRLNELIMLEEECGK
jgi:hypothetical protein